MDELKRLVEKGNVKVSIVGIGYVGLPLLLGFAKEGVKVTGFDLNAEKIKGLNKGEDITGETEEIEIRSAIETGNVSFTSSPDDMKGSDVFIVSVPTPVTKWNNPDLGYVESAAAIIGRVMKKGSVVVLESTVYPGVTEDVMRPILESESGLSCPSEFKMGYSPERINPGDKEHTLSGVVKVVSGTDTETAEGLAALYGKVVKAGTFVARDIKTAEAAKVIENIQRDLNIALVNELSMIFRKMGLNVQDILEAAETKWNFHRYSPGLVGGHCIPVDPYYLVHKAREVGHEPKVILSGRETNNYMPLHVVDILATELQKGGKLLKDQRILVLGLTFKKNIRDIRNTPTKTVVKELIRYGAEVIAHDPMVDPSVIKSEFGADSLDSLDKASGIDCLIVLTDHDMFRRTGFKGISGILKPGAIVLDVRKIFSPQEVSPFKYLTL